MLVGIAFAILQFVPRVEPPSNMKRKTYDDTMQGYYNYPPQTGGGGDPYQQSDYYGQNPSNPAPQSYNVGGVVWKSRRLVAQNNGDLEFRHSRFAT
jgi:hypothetical protein